MTKMNNNNTTRVRFAPSPTGSLHIGSVRTALFNYLFAKRNNGKFLLRIEDTDKNRSTEENVNQIIQSLKWIGLEHDEKIIYQSANIERHKKMAEKLLEEGNAYRCFCTKEELAKEKEISESKGEYYKYSGKCRNLDESQIAENLESGKKFTIRFKTPSGITKFKDKVFKEIAIDNSEFDDFIIIRSDGSPTYNLAVVVDDSDMEISHVIRGEDHLSNTPKQILLYLALNKKVPKFAHLPLITDTEKKRLSKRTGAVSIEEFREMGFTPEGLMNGLVHLGWGTNDDKTIYSMEELIKKFELSRVGKKRAVFDLEKVKWINGKHISTMSADELFPLVVANWQKNDVITEVKYSKDKLLKIIELLKTRMKLVSDFSTYGKYFFKAPERYEIEVVNKRWRVEKVKSLLESLVDEYSKIDDLSLENSEEIVRELAEKNEVKAGVLIHALRLAVTGFGVSPSIFDILVLLGKEQVIKRVKLAIDFGEKKGIFI
ncbi:MAG: glutamate--tRNA ligase [Candidatus Marinimicrobia bacterium]|nr:glutamate--tRNA ligase [Candidatus Neomarinimicrobiota bacterium]